MTKKDYVLIARHINFYYRKALQYTDKPEIAHAIVALTDDLAMDLRNDNPRFDNDKFLEACGILAV